MIEKIRIRGYRICREATIRPHPRMNVLVGDNDAGKSSILEAIGLALTGRLHGRPASEQLNPFWFNQAIVGEFFAQRRAGQPITPPEISIEIFLDDLDEFQRYLYGAHNSEIPTRECAGVSLSVIPDPDYQSEIEAHIASETSLLPVDYYKVDWRSFGDIVLTSRPKELTTAIIDSRTVRSTSGVDYHMRQILNDHLHPDQRAAVSLAFRAVKEQMTSDHLVDVNSELEDLKGALDDADISLAMDQSARNSWDSSVVPHVSGVPFGMAGQGQQAAVKTVLALGHKAGAARVVMVEEPENHLTHTSLNRLIAKMRALLGDEQQMFIATHSSFVLNRLGMDGLLLVSNGGVSVTSDVSDDTVEYFRKLPGYDTLRMVLADRFVLVEGPSDEIVFERFYLDIHGRRPIEDGVDIISMRGLSLARSLELGTVLGKQCCALRDNDGKSSNDILAGLRDFIEDGQREVFVGEMANGPTLEPQILASNPDEDLMREVLGVTPRADPLTWMTNNKTDAALRIAEGDRTLVPPSYMTRAIEFIGGE